MNYKAAANELRAIRLEINEFRYQHGLLSIEELMEYELRRWKLRARKRLMFGSPTANGQHTMGGVFAQFQAGFQAGS